ncbi:MAG: alpha-amylase family glycosyl hydrolase, partial [Myxococcota bacterium]
MTTGFSQFLVLSFVALTLSACGDDDSAPDDDAAVETGVETGVEVGADTSDAGEDAAALRVLSSGSESAFVADDEWYRHAVFYELWVRSFQDSDGDGIGDFPGLTSRLDYLQELGVEALWLMPFFPSPLIDSGYDVADYIGVNPDYGTLEDVDAFLAAAEERGIRVYLDLVFNHVSDQHPWFLDSRENPDGERGDWFVWEDEEGENCSAPLGVFGDERWAFDETRGQYYFHQFFPRQPDLNFESEEVQQALLDSARFWLERGVDGFRLDVPYHYAEEPPECEHLPGSFAFLRRLRALTDEFDASMVGEVLASGDIFDQYLEPDILQMSYSLANIVGTNVLASTGIPGAQFIGL